MNLRHLISDEIMIYPGYVPQPGVRYRVFHYGLEFRVGNWSFDKANWRDTDVVNKCWAKFPDPPDPSTLDKANNENFQRDLLSIECIRTINEALRLHHERKCKDPSLLSTPKLDTAKEVEYSRKFGKIDKSYAVKSTNNSEVNHSQESSESNERDASRFSSLRFWIVVLWAVSGLGFVAVMLFLFSIRKGKGTRSKHHRNKRRTSYS